MKILLTGSTGLLGRALRRRLSRLGDVTGLARGQTRPLDSSGPREIACDLQDARRVAEVVQQVQPDVVVHTQALSDVDRCEQEPSLAEAMNVRTTAHLVDALRRSSGWFVDVSTDYVFDGRKGAPYDEADEARPISVYGWSKLRAEAEALRHPTAVVVRASTLFGPDRMNFCDHVRRCLAERRPVEAFVDQTTSPTYTEDLADALAELVERLPGRTATPRVLHMAGGGACTRLEFAQRVAVLTGGDPTLIRPIRMADQHRPAARPRYLALASHFLDDVIGRTLRPWHEALADYLRQHPSVN